MIQAIEVARYLVHLAAEGNEEPDYLSHLRLQKLLYYVQGWSLAMLNKPMFPERIEAWAHGPVVRDIYRQFNEKGRRAITLGDFESQGDFELDEKDRELIGAVWDTLKDHSALSLRKMTHDEPPWMNARKGFDAADRCEVEITHEAMRVYFTALAD